MKKVISLVLVMVVLLAGLVVLTGCEEKGKKVIFSRAGKYIKFYAMEITGWDGSEESKPRELLQTLGTDVIRECS